MLKNCKTASLMVLFVGLATGLYSQDLSPEKIRTDKARIQKSVFGLSVPDAPPAEVSKDDKKKQKAPEKPDSPSIYEMTAMPDGSLAITGIIGDEKSIPKSEAVNKLSSGAVGENSCFIAKLSPDAQKIIWFSVLQPQFLLPQTMQVAKDGSIYVGGKVLDNFSKCPEFISKDIKEPEKYKAGIIKLSPDGKKLVWAKLGGPNQSEITGMAIDPKNRLIWTGSPSGQGQSSYVLRCDADGKGIDWSECGDKPSWAIYLAKGDKQLEAPGQYFELHNKAGKDGFDYDGANNKWGKLQWWDFCFRLGGQVICLPDGDIVVSSALFFKFKVDGGTTKSEPAYNLFLARYSPEGKIKWSTNLYQPNDSVHTPDQKPIDLAYDPKSDMIYMLAKQHGSNIYRLMGDLRGDTGNMMICWLGKVEAKTGKLVKGWYFMNNRCEEKDGQGGYEANGMPKSPPHPKLAGNALNKVAVSENGLVFLAGSGAAKMWTSPNADMKWPADQDGGGQACLIVLDPDLNYIYSSCIGNGTKDLSGTFNGLAITKNGIFAAGTMKGKGSFASEDKTPWSADSADGRRACMIKVNW